MNLLDENIREDQRGLLQRWRIPVHQIGVDLGEKGMLDAEIIPLLLALRSATFFTRDLGFSGRGYCHARYCVACLAVEKDEVAVFVRRVLRHPELNTKAKRMGTVLRVSHAGLLIWRKTTAQAAYMDW